MKTPYEARAKYGINRLVFGKVKKKARVFYWLLFFLYLFVGLVIGI